MKQILKYLSDNMVPLMIGFIAGIFATGFLVVLSKAITEALWKR